MSKLPPILTSTPEPPSRLERTIDVTRIGSAQREFIASIFDGTGREDGDYAHRPFILDSPPMHPRMWSCAYCGGTEPDSLDSAVVVGCTRCGAPRPC